VSGSKVAKLIALAADPAAFEGERAVALRKAADLTERAQPSTLRVTEKNIDSLPAPETGSRIYRETGIAGLGLRVTAAGARSWTLDYVCNGRQRRYTVGPRHAFTLKAATIEAKRLHGQIAQGVDPFDLKAEREAAAAAKLAAEKATREAEREAERLATDPAADPNVAFLADRWFKEYGERELRPTTLKSARSMLKKINALKFGEKKVREVKPADVRALMDKLTDTPVRANRVRAFLSGLFSFAIRLGIGGLTEASANPARRQKQILSDNKEYARKVIVPSQAQIDALHSALDAHAGEQGADVIRLLLWSGARKREIMEMEWSEIENLDGDDPVWVLPPERAKQKRERRFPLADPQVLDLLRRRHAQTGASRFVFPGERPGKPLSSVTRLWGLVRDEAGMSRFTVHDLRHVFVSAGLNDGIPLFTMSELVGHSTTTMTARYGHLASGAAEDAVKRIGRRLAPTKPSAPEMNGATHGQ